MRALGGRGLRKSGVVCGTYRTGIVQVLVAYDRLTNLPNLSQHPGSASNICTEKRHTTFSMCPPLVLVA